MISPWCCDSLADAAMAIIEREKLKQLADDKKRIEDSHAKVASN
jgi:hypothetical protein